MRINIVPPPIYLLLFIAMAWACKAFFPWASIDTIVDWQGLPTTKLVIALFLLLSGAMLDLTSLATYLYRKTTVNPISLGKSTQLVTSGFYRYTRNPMYLGLLFTLSAAVVYLGNMLALLLLPVFLLVLTEVQIKPEEKSLEALFSEDYRHYKRRVRRWL